MRHDTLTGLTNRFSFTEHLEVRRARLEQTGQGFAVMLIDLDRFKIINDTMGHPAGDELLKQVAIRLRLGITDGDFVSRLGGDEFAAILSDTVNCANFARSLGETLRAPYHIQGQSVTIGSSMGISMAPIHGTDTSVLMKRVDMALYRSKGNGRDTFYIFETERDEPKAHWALP
ncbi:GGDEF domain-containing protein [Tardiphaga sp. vice304]|uniref:GGDEF domain-containing protein n=1 Tax=Tardiphaga sp. vice304 TaxID=2592817 RepID=UPI001FEDA0B9|nr:GGDEF domain-containing protein [Tardiphaga sp. vice304]